VIENEKPEVKATILGRVSGVEIEKDMSATY